MRTIRIGRSQTNDCIFANNTVSGIHAVLVVDESGERGTLKDLNSTNGTFVNNKRIIVESSGQTHKAVWKFQVINSGG
ncbi:MAG: FHA domain-containing protein, partial [Bacteroidales bacterium]|nr:FHA domain-containing protein [Bacteroidales bacterium]